MDSKDEQEQSEWWGHRYPARNVFTAWLMGVTFGFGIAFSIYNPGWLGLPEYIMLGYAALFGVGSTFLVWRKNGGGPR
jgi:hypothetical protein